MKKVLGNLFFVGVMAAGFINVSAQLPNREPKPATPPAPPAQQPEIPVSPCPTLEVRTGAPQYVRDGVPVTFTVTLSGGDQKVAPMFNWAITSGVVNSGQGTSSIKVDSTGAGQDKAITASVQIGGFPPECAADGSVTVNIAGPAKKLDEYGAVTEADENARLDAFISNVTDKEQAYIFAYAGRTSPRGQASNDLKRIRTHLLAGGAAKERLVVIDGGFREETSYELWLVPIGAEAPRSTPTLKAKDIVYPKPTPPAPKKP